MLNFTNGNEAVDLKSTVTSYISEMQEDLQNIAADAESSPAVKASAIIEIEKRAKELSAVAALLTSVASEYKGASTDLKGDLLADMTAADLKSAVVGAYKLTRAKSPASVDLQVEAEDLPAEFQRVSADKRALTKALKDGRQVDGATLKQGEHIRISLAR